MSLGAAPRVPTRTRGRPSAAIAASATRAGSAATTHGKPRSASRPPAPSDGTGRGSLGVEAVWTTVSRRLLPAACGRFEGWAVAADDGTAGVRTARRLRDRPDCIGAGRAATNSGAATDAPVPWVRDACTGTEPPTADRGSDDLAPGDDSAAVVSTGSASSGAATAAGSDTSGTSTAGVASAGASATGAGAGSGGGGACWTGGAGAGCGAGGRLEAGWGDGAGGGGGTGVARPGRSVSGST
jgi:hypothetical protein